MERWTFGSRAFLAALAVVAFTNPHQYGRVSTVCPRLAKCFDVIESVLQFGPVVSSQFAEDRRGSFECVLVASDAALEGPSSWSCDTHRPLLQFSKVISTTTGRATTRLLSWRCSWFARLFFRSFVVDMEFGWTTTWPAYASLMCLIRGRSHSAELEEICHFIHVVLFALKASLYGEYIPSVANWVDPISRTGLKDMWHQRRNFATYPASEASSGGRHWGGSVLVVPWVRVRWVWSDFRLISGGSREYQPVRLQLPKAINLWDTRAHGSRVAFWLDKIWEASDTRVLGKKAIVLSYIAVSVRLWMYMYIYTLSIYIYICFYLYIYIYIHINTYIFNITLSIYIYIYICFYTCPRIQRKILISAQETLEESLSWSATGGCGGWSARIRGQCGALLWTLGWVGAVWKHGGRNVCPISI